MEDMAAEGTAAIMEEATTGAAITADITAIMATITGEAMEDGAQDWVWDYWADSVWAITAAAPGFILPLTDMGTGDTVTLLSPIPRWLPYRRRRLFTYSARMSCKCSPRPRHPISGIIAAIRKGTILM